jgi:hypothetical protein
MTITRWVTPRAQHAAPLQFLMNPTPFDRSRCNRLAGTIAEKQEAWHA